MEEKRKESLVDLLRRHLYTVPLVLSGFLFVFAVMMQPDFSLLTGFWKIQISEAGLITDPVAIGGVGAALLNAALVLFLSTMMVRRVRAPFAGVSLACLFMMGGFALLGKNLLNMTPILIGGWLYSRYKQESFARVIYLTMYATCLSPLVSFTLTFGQTWLRWPLMVLCGVLIGFLVPAVGGFTIRVHQGYNLYNVGFAAGFVGLAVASVLKAFGVELAAQGSWSTDSHAPLCVMLIMIVLGLLLLGIVLGCSEWKNYKPVLRHSGRAVADFILLDGVAVAFVNMAVVGAIGLVYILALYPTGVRLNGPLTCCIISIMGYGAFGMHPKNILPVMLGAILAAFLMPQLPFDSPSALLAVLLCTGLAPVSGRFGWGWGVVAGFLHMCIVQYTGALQGGMNLYNNGFTAGLVCVLLVPIIEALTPEPEEE